MYVLKRKDGNNRPVATPKRLGCRKSRALPGGYGTMLHSSKELPAIRHSRMRCAETKLALTGKRSHFVRVLRQI